jgi:hypothetical protein
VQLAVIEGAEGRVAAYPRWDYCKQNILVFNDPPVLEVAPQFVFCHDGILAESTHEGLQFKVLLMDVLKEDFNMVFFVDSNDIRIVIHRFFQRKLDIGEYIV